MKCTARYKNGLTIESETREYGVVMDAAPPLGKKNGMTPGELLLNSLAGCKLMSLISIAKKEGMLIEEVSLEITGEVGYVSSESKGKEFRKLHTIYKIKSDRDIDTLEKLITKADEVCTVGNSLKDSIEKINEIKIN